MLYLYNKIAPAIDLPQLDGGSVVADPKVFAIARAIREAVKENPKQAICGLMGGNCGCAGDEYGIDPETAICDRVAALIEAHLQKSPETT